MEIHKYSKPLIWEAEILTQCCLHPVCHISHVMSQIYINIYILDYLLEHVLLFFNESNLFQSIGPLGRCFLKVEMAVRLSVRLFVRLSVCSLLRYHLNVFFPPLPEVRCSKFLEIQNLWRKVIERNGLTFEHFCSKVVEDQKVKQQGSGG